MVSRCCTATLLLTLVTTVRFLEWSAVSDPMSRPNLEICRAARAAAGTGQQTEEILQALGSCMPEGGQSTRKFVLQSAANFDLVVWSSCLGFFSLVRLVDLWSLSISRPRYFFFFFALY